MTDSRYDARNAHEIRRLLEQVVAAGTIPGVWLAVADPDRTLYAGAAGHADLATARPATPYDQFPWFSMTKIVTATAAMRLARSGALDLDLPIGAYLDGYRPHPRHGHPTTRQLLTHTAGLANPIPVRWVRPDGQVEDVALVNRILVRHGTPRRPVGGRAAYSNIGYLLAGRVIEAVAESSVQDHVRQAVLEPLGMHHTGFAYRAGGPRAVGYVKVPRPVNPLLRRALPRGIAGPRVGSFLSLQPFLVTGAAYGGLVGSITDAARLAATHAAGPPDAHPLLDQETLEEMRRITHPGKRFDHGIGWFRPPHAAGRRPAYVEHYGTGGGFWNAMRVYPARRLAMVASANTTSRWDFDALFSHLLTLPWS